MPLILNEDEGKKLGKKQVIVPKKLVTKLKNNLNLFGKYKKTNGFKRASSIVDDDYNKRSNKKDKIHTDDKTISFSDLKRIDHDMRHANPNPHNLEYVLQGGNDMKTWSHDTLRKLRTSVKQVDAVPQVPKLETDTPKLPEPQKDIKMGSANVRLTESNDDWHPYYDSVEENGVYNVLCDFLNSNSNKQQWEPLIQPEMYKKALSEFIKFGKFVHFPTKYIYQWMGIIMNNTAKLRANTELAGHESFFPFYELKDAIEQYPDKFIDAIKECGELNDDNYYEILDYVGLYDWMSMPDGSDAWSDYGLPALEEVISEYRENMSPEETIVIINKALDCAHPRGDLSSIFIVGGSKTLTSISESIKKNKKIIVNESQLLTLKEYHDQMVFNFDNEGNPYYEKNNYEHYIDFLESIGKYGMLPKSQWSNYDIVNAIENEKEQLDFSADGTDEEIFKTAFEDLVCQMFIYEKEDIEEVFTEDFLSYFNDYSIYKENNNYYDECDTLKKFMYEKEITNDTYNLDDFLTYDGYKKYQNTIREIYADNLYEYNIEDNLTINDRGLIYIERNIKIPKFNEPNFKYPGQYYRNYYNYLKNSFFDLGNCFSWAEGKGEAYCGLNFGGNSSEIKLKCWVDPKDVNWKETVYRNCYGLRYEQEIYINKSGAKIEVFDVILEYGEVNGQRVSGKSLLNKPIIITY